MLRFICLCLFFYVSVSLSNFNVVFSPSVSGSLSNATISLFVNSTESIGNSTWDVLTVISLTYPGLTLSLDAGGSSVFIGLDSISSWGTQNIVQSKMDRVFVIRQTQLPLVSGPVAIRFMLTNLRLPDSCSDLGDWTISIGNLSISGNPASDTITGCQPAAIINVPAYFECQENSIAQVPLVSVNESVSAIIMQVNITSNNGTPSVNFSSSSLVQKVKGHAVLLTGVQSDLNQSLASLTFQPDKDFWGITDITISVDNMVVDGPGPHRVSSNSVVVNVTAVVSPPRITASNSFYSVNWNNMTRIDANVTQPDDLTNQRQLTLNITMVHGELLFFLANFVNGVQYFAAYDATKWNASHLIRANGSIISAILGNMTYRSTEAVYCYETLMDAIQISVSEVNTPSLSKGALSIPIYIISPGAYDTCSRKSESMWALKFNPISVMQDEKVVFRFYGTQLLFLQASGFQFSIVPAASDCNSKNWTSSSFPLAVKMQQQQPQQDAFALAAVSIHNPGQYTVCMKPIAMAGDKNDVTFWMPLTSSSLQVKAVAQNCSDVIVANRPVECSVPFSGFGTCEEYLTAANAVNSSLSLCGCFFTTKNATITNSVTGVVSVDSSATVVSVPINFWVSNMIRSALIPITLNSGCCVKSPLRKQVTNSSNGELWGVCSG